MNIIRNKFLVLPFFSIVLYSLSMISVYAYPLIITEALPNPVGTDSQGEFIEVYNSSNYDVDVTDLLMDNNNVIAYPGEELGIIAPGEFFIIHDDNFDIKMIFPGEYKRGVVSSTSLANSGDNVIIQNSEGNIFDTLSYDSSTEGRSIVRPEILCKTSAQFYSGRDHFCNWKIIQIIPILTTIFPLVQELKLKMRIITGRLY